MSANQGHTNVHRRHTVCQSQCLLYINRNRVILLTSTMTLYTKDVRRRLVGRNLTTITRTSNNTITINTAISNSNRPNSQEITNSVRHTTTIITRTNLSQVNPNQPLLTRVRTTRITSQRIKAHTVISFTTNGSHRPHLSLPTSRHVHELNQRQRYTYNGGDTYNRGDTYNSEHTYNRGFPILIDRHRARFPLISGPKQSVCVIPFPTLPSSTKTVGATPTAE